MEDLVAAEAGVVPARPLHRVQHAAHGVQHAAQHQPHHPRRGQQPHQRDDGRQGQPAHHQIDDAGEPAGDVQLGDGEDDPGKGQGPDHRQEGDSAVLPEDGGADGGVAPGDEQIDGAVVVLPQGDALGHRGIDTVVQGAGGVQTDHGQAVDQKDHGVEPVPLPQGASHQQQSADHRQPRADAVGNGRPGPQAVIGVPHLFPAAGFYAGDRSAEGHSRFTHQEHSFLSRTAGTGSRNAGEFRLKFPLSNTVYPGPMGISI